MTWNRFSFAPALVATLVFLGPAGAALAGQRAEVRAQQPPVRTGPEARDSRETRIELSQDATQTRVQLQELLRRYSPALGGVLKLDPGLLGNADYLAPYPGLTEFLARHPEVAHDPAYFFEDVEIPSSQGMRSLMDPRAQTINLWRGTMEGSMILIVFLVVTSTLVWLIKTLIDYRRWSRLSKVQADVHNKLLDRFAANEELLAYVQAPAGRRFLESAPITLDPAGPAIAAPLRRILFAVEAGFVIMAGGIGLQFVSGRLPQEVSPMVLALGVLGVALGIGFVVAAAASYFISRRMGLFQQAPAPPPTDGV